MPASIKVANRALVEAARLTRSGTQIGKGNGSHFTSPARGEGARNCPQCPPATRIGASSDIPTRYQTKTASSATGMPISEVQMKNQTKPVCSITKPENPARMLPGKAQSEVKQAELARRMLH